MVIMKVRFFPRDLFLYKKIKVFTINNISLYIILYNTYYRNNITFLHNLQTI